MIKSTQIINELHAKMILDGLQATNLVVENYEENTPEYEDLCDQTQEQFVEVLEYLGLLPDGDYCDQDVITKTYLILMTAWQYLNENDVSMERYDKLQEDIHAILYKQE